MAALPFALEVAGASLAEVPRGAIELCVEFLLVDVEPTALGFGDIPPQAFFTALQLIPENGWVAFNIKETDPEDNTKEYAYDDNENLIETRETDVAQLAVDDECFLATKFYDSLDRLQRSTDNIGQTHYFRYDSRDNLVAVADAHGPPGPIISRRAFSPGRGARRDPSAGAAGHLLRLRAAGERRG